MSAKPRAGNRTAGLLIGMSGYAAVMIGYLVESENLMMAGGFIGLLGLLILDGDA